MSDDSDHIEDEDVEVPDPDPTAIIVINEWLDELTEYGQNDVAIRDTEYTAGELAGYAGVTTPEASQMLQVYRNYNWLMDERCMYVIAHEGHYGAGAPWRLLGTAYAISEATRRIYRLNQVRHLAWEFYDHAKKEIKSFGAEQRQALVQVDAYTRSNAASNQRLAIRDYARDLLQNMRVRAQTQAERIIDTMGVPRRSRDEYLKYFFDGFWPYVEVMVDEEVQVLEELIAA